jgi:prepilin peptidase CpaA
VEIVPAAAAAVVAAAAAVLDLRFRRIPNWLTGGAILLGLVLHTWLDGPAGALTALGGMALGLALLLPFYTLRLAGARAVSAGDVKLLAALGALVGPVALIPVALYSGVIGGMLSLVVLLQHGRLFGTVRQMLVLRTLPAPSGLKAPYGVAIAGGMALSLVLPGVIA